MNRQAENLSREELNKSIKEKDKALAAMKLELRIEASLESVRAVALQMKKREDMLQICTTIAKQLELLHVKEIRNVQTALFKEENGTYMNYEYYAKHDKTFVTETKYTDHEIQSAFAEKMLKGNGESMEAHIKGDEVKDWLAYQKTTNVFIDNFLETASSVNYYWFSLGPVALGTSTYEPLKKKDIALFKRFLKVFELSYRRYLDIEKAEAQAREAHIETTIEKVRSRSLAMHNSSEVLEVVKAVFERLSELSIELNTAFIIIFKEGSRDTEWWLVNKDKNHIKITVQTKAQMQSPHQHHRSLNHHRFLRH